MPHSLRAKLSGLRYKGILEDKDYKRLCHALDLEKAEQEPTTRQSCENCKQDPKECGNDAHYGFCQNWEKAEQEPTIEAYEQVCKERDIAIEQLHELGYELGQKIEPCDDAVSRQAVLECATLITSIPTEDWDIGDWVCLFRDRVSQLPPVRPQEQTGHWIRQDNTKEPLYGWYFCSECKSVIGDKTKFCSNCGAKMVEPQESEE